MDTPWGQQPGMGSRLPGPGVQPSTSSFMKPQQILGASLQMNPSALPVQSLPNDPSAASFLPANAMMSSSGGLLPVGGLATSNFPSSSAIAMSISGFQEGLNPGQLAMGAGSSLGNSFGLLTGANTAPEALSMATLNANQTGHLSTAMRQRTETWPSALNVVSATGPGTVGEHLPSSLSVTARTSLPSPSFSHLPPAFVGWPSLTALAIVLFVCQV